MTYPAGLTTITVRHKVVTAGGRHLKGNTVTAVPADRVWATDGSIVQHATSTTIADDGTWELNLPQVDQAAIRNKGVPWKITEHVPGSTRSYYVAPLLAHGTGPIDVAEALVSAPSSRETVIQAGPVTDETAAGLLDQGGQFKASLSATIDARVQQGTIRMVSGAVRLSSSDPRVVEVYAVAAASVHGVALATDTAAVFSRTAAGQWRYMVVGAGHTEWQDAPGDGTTEVIPTGPAWTDNVLDGGGTWAASQVGVVYDPATGSATPGQTVTVDAVPATGYYFPSAAVTSWTHTFPQPLAPTVADDFTAPDGTALAGRATPTGSLTWAADTAGSPIAGFNATAPATLRNNRLQKPTGNQDGLSAQLTLPPNGNRYEIAADYGLATGSRIYLGVAGSFEGQRITCFLDYTQGLKMFRWTAGGTTSVTQMGATVTDLPTSGRIALGYDGTKAYVKIDGTKVLEVTTAPTGLGGRCAIGLGVGTGQWLDNFEARLLP